MKDINSVVSEDYLKHIVLDLKQMKEFIKNPVIMAEADGVWLKDITGKKYLDGTAGVYVVNVGHNNPRIKEAIKRQLDKITFVPPLHATNPPAVELAKKVSEITPGDLNTVKLLSGGSEATESAMKLARQYHRQTGNPGKYKILSRYMGFHGCTMGGALSATGCKDMKVKFEPLLEGFIHVLPPLCYHCPYDLEYPTCNVLCARMIETIIEMEGPESVAAFILEPIGNIGGCVTPPKEYFSILREICDTYNVLLIFDEIVTGFGRTGNMFAAQTFETIPDVICMGKGMSGGYTPLAAIAFNNKIAGAFWGEKEEKIEFLHGHTYGGNPLSSAVGLACIEEIMEQGLCNRAKVMGGYLREKLEGMRKLGIVGDIRGKGLFQAVEFVRDEDSKKPFSEKTQFGKQVANIALEKGLICRGAPHWICLAPPLIITREEIDYAVEILEESINTILER